VDTTLCKDAELEIRRVWLTNEGLVRTPPFTGTLNSGAGVSEWLVRTPHPKVGIPNGGADVANRRRETEGPHRLYKRITSGLEETAGDGRRRREQAS
jgi:hypothetical protein